MDSQHASSPGTPLTPGTPSAAPAAGHRDTPARGNPPGAGAGHADGAGPAWQGRPPGLSSWNGTWQAMLAAALASFALGLILLLWPRASVVTVAVLIGIALLVVGVLKLVQGLTGDQESATQRAAYVVIGILAGLAGLYCLRHINVTVGVLAFVVGLFWAMHGVVDVVVAVGGQGPRRGLLAVAGLFSLAAGLIIIFWPAISLTILVAVIGAWLIFDAFVLVLMALGLRQFVASQAQPV